MNIHLKLLGVAILWGASWAWAKIVTHQMPIITSAGIRFTLALLPLLFWLHHKSHFRTLSQLSFPQWGGLALAGFFGVIAYSFFFMNGLKYIPASKASVIVALNPALTILLSALIFGERLNKIMAFGMILAVGGAMWVTSQGQLIQLFQHGLSWQESLIFGCVVSWAIYTLLARKILNQIDPLTVTVVNTFVGAMGLMVWGIVTETAQWSQFGSASWSAWWALLGLAFGSTALGYAWYFDGVQQLGAGKASAYIVFVPIFGILCSAWWLKEDIHHSLISGGIFAIIGMILMQLKR